MGNINSDEFETMIELVLCVLFMSFGAWAMSRMVYNLSQRVDILDTPDKIEISERTHYAEDPFYFTAYQAYMFGWHMDELSYEDLYWVGGGLGGGSTHFGDSSDRYARIGVLQEDGEIMNQFYTWRNQMITGIGAGTNRSVKSAINSMGGGPAFYRGMWYAADGATYLYHLELTDKFTILNNLGSDPNTGGKSFKWVLVPRTKKKDT